MRRILAAGPREDRAIATLAAGCLVLFVASWGRLAREAAETGQELVPLMSNTLYATLFVVPLLMYGIAALSHLIAKPFGAKGGWFAARMALFWTLLATSPLLILWGLTSGLIGPGPQEQITGLIWLVAFVVLWTLNLREAERIPLEEAA